MLVDLLKRHEFDVGELMEKLKDENYKREFGGEGVGDGFGSCQQIFDICRMPLQESRPFSKMIPFIPMRRR